jgi:hypothetical protein
MTWEIEWGPVATRDLLSLRQRSVAERIDAAILRFAVTSRGPVERVYPDTDRCLRLVVSGAVALLDADPTTGILYVGRIFPRQS